MFTRPCVTEKVATRYEPLRGAQNPAADVNDDGRITSLDALMILKAAAGRIEL